MKNIVFLFLLTTIFFSCKKTKELLDIPFSFTTKNDFTLPKISDQEVNVPDSLIVVQSPEITNTIPDEFKKNRADINKLKSATVETIDLIIKSPPTQNFGFMKSIKIYLGAPGKGEKLIATKDNIHTITPAPTTLSLSSENADVSDYIKGATYYLRIETALVRTYTQDILVGSEVKFRIVANPLN